MPIESLPGKPIEYPITHFQPVQGRPVIPTAAYAAQIAKALGDLAKQLSPEEREKHQLELKLLRARFNQADLQNQWTKQQLDLVRSATGTRSRVNSIVSGLYNGTTSPDGTSGAPPSNPNMQLAPVDPREPDTHAMFLYGPTEGKPAGGPISTIAQPDLESDDPVSLESPLSEEVTQASDENELPAMPEGSGESEGEL